MPIIYPVKFVANPDNPDEIITERDTERVFPDPLPFTPNKPHPHFTQKWKCKECGWIGTQDSMDSDYVETEDDELWSNWICPSCFTWWGGLESGYEKVDE